MTVLEDKIHNFTNSIQESLAQQNYFAALALALMAPDICSKLEYPEKHTKERYKNWFNELLADKYQSEIGPQKEVHNFLTGSDFYALRCSFLHQGEVGITEQKARERLHNFIFVKPKPGGMVHMNQINDTLQLQVDIFCVDILLAVERWVELHKNDHMINGRAQNIIEIKSDFSF
ncbi:hypothetical protein [Sporosarcina sp. JAI121]|uniref:hypothetical protein n=1 Tax=Sporosarcina sp. JAI121 TaxID=2723064 RepID=UPI0015CCD588|nr:hypothetical protein [Sporosarcina sp. JAI121]NYF23634.1 hypothetical protein [Sporosarcina sp. JAI121]